MTLIDAYELEREMYRKCMDTDEEIEKGRAKWDSGLWIRYKVFEEAITLAPRVDAEPVRHGHWCVTQAYPHTIYCSECFQRFAQAHWAIWEDGSLPRDYCPNCGAKMDEVRDE